jgi:hypothetical protein
MEYIGLLFEALFLIFGIYVYLFARGIVRSRNPELQKKAEAFRSANALWLRLVGLAIIAIMGLNLFLHIQQLLSGS